MTSSRQEMVNEKAITHMLDRMRGGFVDISYNNEKIELGNKLGEGGSKTVYEAVIMGDIFALAVPNAVDNTSTMLHKWSIALQEPRKTKKVRDVGLLTNPIVKKLNIVINGVPFKGIKMLRNQDLPFKVMDFQSSRSIAPIRMELPNKLTNETFESYFSTTIDDIKLLIQNGIGIGRDQFKICILDGVPRIYLSDLSRATFDPFLDTEKIGIGMSYIENAMDALLTDMPYAENQQHRDFFSSRFFSHNNQSSIYNNMKNSLLKII